MRFSASLAGRAAAWVATVGLALLAPSTARSTTLVDQSIPQMAAHAQRVVIGHVTSVRTWLDRSHGLRVRTEATVAIDEALKGSAEPKEVVLHQLGGTAGEGKDRYTQTIPGSPVWKSGEAVVLFLEPTDTGRLVTSGLAMGKYVLEHDAQGHVMARRDSHDLTRVHRRRQPDRVFLGAAPSDERLPLSELRRLVAGGKLPLVFPKVIRPMGEVIR